MPLSRLLAGLEGIARVTAPPHNDGAQGCPAGDPAADPPVTALAFHSAEVTPGAVFVAVRGVSRDGHDFVEEALMRGAHAVVVDRPEVAQRLRRQGPPCVVVQVQDSRLALAHLAARWFGEPARELAVVGVTGTVGKTSTALFLRQLLNSCGLPTGAIGSLGIFARTRRAPSPLTTPDPVTLQGWLRAMADEGLWGAVIEVSSHALIQHRASGVRLRAGIVTELVPHEHTDVHPTFADYLAAKRRFLELLADQAPLVYSAASPATAELARSWPAGQRLRYGLKSQGQQGGWPAEAAPSGEEAGWVCGHLLGMDLMGTWLEVAAGTGPPRRQFGPVRVRLGLLGPHSAANALAALAAAFALGLEWEVLVAALEQLRAPRRRMEVIYRGPFTVIDDTTGHPASFQQLFEVLQRAGSSPLVLVVGVRGSRGPDINARNGRAIAEWSRRVPLRKVIVTSSEEAADAANRVQPHEREALLGALRTGQAPVAHYATLEQALQAALEVIRPGDVLVLAGAQGMDRAAMVFRRLVGSGDGTGLDHGPLPVGGVPPPGPAPTTG